MKKHFRPCSQGSGLFLWALVFVIVCCHRTAQRPADIYVLLVDTLRADHLSSYGYSRPTSAALDHFAESAFIFTNVTAPSSWTLPSVGSVFTARYPTVHGLRAHGGKAPDTVLGLRPGLASMAEALQRSGYYTAAVIANIWLRKSNKTGADRGFMEYEVIGNARADEVNRRAQEILDQHPDTPVFLYLHYMEPHPPYAAADLPPSVLGPVPGGDMRLPDGQVGRARHMIKREAWADDEGRTLGEVIDAYDRTIYQWDQSFGRFVDWLGEHGRLDRSWISVVADHGEELFEHGGWGHGTALFEEQMKVPWVLRAPGGRLRGRSTAPVSLIDVAPTMLTAAGVAIPDTMKGLDARRAPERRVLFAEVDACRGDWHSCFQRAVWDGSHKLFLQQTNSRFYNLRDDPREQVALSQDPQLLKVLNDWIREEEATAQQFGSSSSEAIDPGVRERLHALGY